MGNGGSNDSNQISGEGLQKMLELQKNEENGRLSSARDVINHAKNPHASSDESNLLLVGTEESNNEKLSKEELANDVLRPSKDFAGVRLSDPEIGNTLALPLKLSISPDKDAVEDYDESVVENVKKKNRLSVQLGNIGRKLTEKFSFSNKKGDGDFETPKRRLSSRLSLRRLSLSFSKKDKEALQDSDGKPTIRSRISGSFSFIKKTISGPSNKDKEKELFNFDDQNAMEEDEEEYENDSEVSDLNGHARVESKTLNRLEKEADEIHETGREKRGRGAAEGKGNIPSILLSKKDWEKEAQKQEVIDWLNEEIEKEDKEDLNDPLAGLHSKKIKRKVRRSSKKTGHGSRQKKKVNGNFGEIEISAQPQTNADLVRNPPTPYQSMKQKRKLETGSENTKEEKKGEQKSEGSPPVVILQNLNDPKKDRISELLSPKTPTMLPKVSNSSNNVSLLTPSVETKSSADASVKNPYEALKAKQQQQQPQQVKKPVKAISTVRSNNVRKLGGLDKKDEEDKRSTLYRIFEKRNKEKEEKANRVLAPSPNSSKLGS